MLLTKWQTVPVCVRYGTTNPLLTGSLTLVVVAAVQRVQTGIVVSTNTANYHHNIDVSVIWLLFQRKNRSVWSRMSLRRKKDSKVGLSMRCWVICTGLVLACVMHLVWWILDRSEPQRLRDRVLGKAPALAALQ